MIGTGFTPGLTSGAVVVGNIIVLEVEVKIVDIVIVCVETVETNVLVNVTVTTRGVARKIVERASVPPNDWASGDGNSGSAPTIHPVFGSIM